MVCHAVLPRHQVPVPSASHIQGLKFSKHTCTHTHVEIENRRKKKKKKKRQKPSYLTTFKSPGTRKKEIIYAGNWPQTNTCLGAELCDSLTHVSRTYKTAAGAFPPFLMEVDRAHIPCLVSVSACVWLPSFVSCNFFINPLWCPCSPRFLLSLRTSPWCFD